MLQRPDSCNGQCVDTNSDTSNCGSCGNACASGQTMRVRLLPGRRRGGGGGGCSNGQTSCNGRCVDTNSDTSNCGSCGNACASRQMCLLGMCLP